MDRRSFLAGAGAALFASGAAEPPRGKIPRIGVLLFSNPRSDASLPALLNGLKEAGYVEGSTMTLEYRSAEGRAERLPALVEDLAHAQCPARD